MPDTAPETSPAEAQGATVRVASTVMRVLDVDRTVDFYCDVFACRVALRERDAVLLLAPDGFQIYLYAKDAARHHGVGAVGVEYLMWATDSEAELGRITERLRTYDPATYTYTENGVTFVEGCKPDHGRVIVAYPGPGLLPREMIGARFRGH
ncbi:VOC family protein [Mycobacterium sp. 2YAF39]|uniref:VOC family protein n=1 Tax=Mycobacterium sp. 2YAF39 TaxID=3233033 RepID=UPI003F9B2FB5